MLRYHKKIYFPDTAEKDLSEFTNKLNKLNWGYTAHSIDNIKYRVIDNKSILLFIRDLKLDSKNIFEYYADDNGIIKTCYRIPYMDNMDIILVLSECKEIITIYLNSNTDLHYFLKQELYSKI